MRGRIKKSKVFNSDLIYLATISNKYGLNLGELLNFMLIARDKGEIGKGRLNVLYRGCIREQSIFLILLESKVVAQLRLADKFLHEIVQNSELLEDIQKTLKPRETRENESRSISELIFGLKKVNIKARVTEKSPIKKVISRYGNPCLISMITITDRTGSIKIPLWNEQIKKISVGDTIQIENGRVKSFRGEKQLTLNAKSKIMVLS